MGVGCISVLVCVCAPCMILCHKFSRCADTAWGRHWVVGTTVWGLTWVSEDPTARLLWNQASIGASLCAGWILSPSSPAWGVNTTHPTSWSMAEMNTIVFLFSAKRTFIATGCGYLWTLSPCPITSIKMPRSVFRGGSAQEIVENGTISPSESFVTIIHVPRCRIVKVLWEGEERGVDSRLVNTLSHSLPAAAFRSGWLQPRRANSRASKGWLPGFPKSFLVLLC